MSFYSGSCEATSPRSPEPHSPGRAEKRLLIRKLHFDDIRERACRRSVELPKTLQRMLETIAGGEQLDFRFNSQSLPPGDAG